jgi:hypothetical protein
MKDSDVFMSQPLSIISRPSGALPKTHLLVSYADTDFMASLDCKVLRIEHT